MGRTLLVLTALASSLGIAHANPAGAPAPAAERLQSVRVAIVPGIAVNLDTARVDALSQELAEALSAQLEVEAIGGLEVRRLLPPDGVPPDCVTTPECVADVAQRTSADQLLFVVMVDSGSGGSVQIDTTWVDANSNRSASRPAIDLTSTSEAGAKFRGAASSLLPDAPVRGAQQPGDTGIRVDAMTEAVPRHLTTPAKITAAVAVVGLGVGIAFGLKTRSKYDACESDLVRCSDSKRDSIRTFGILADVGFAVAAGAAITTAVLYLTSSEEPRLILAPTEGGGTVSAFGRF